MFNKKLLVIMSVFLMLIVTGSVYAIAGGVPDGDGHPAVGVIFFDLNGDGEITGNGDGVLDFATEDYPQCSGSYAGVTDDANEYDVFLTAAHCLDGLQEEGINHLMVVFDNDILEGADVFSGDWSIDPGLVTPTSVGFYMDPAYDYGSVDPHDSAVVLFPKGSISSMGIDPVELPPAGYLDDLKAAKKLKKTPITLAAYGVSLDRSIMPPRLSPFSYDFVRQTGTTTIQGLNKTKVRLRAHKNAEPGLCSLDSGSPQFIDDSNMIVSIHYNGKGFCGATTTSYRLDIRSARDFLGQYLALP